MAVLAVPAAALHKPIIPANKAGSAPVAIPRYSSSPGQHNTFNQASSSRPLVLQGALVSSLQSFADPFIRGAASPRKAPYL